MINNLTRDMRWLTDVGLLTAGTAVDFTSTPSVKTDGVTYAKHGYVQIAPEDYAGTAGEMQYFGVKLSWDDRYDAVPFRVKGTVNKDEGLYGLGWTNSGGATVTPFGGANLRYVDGGRRVDDVWCVRRPAAIADGNFPIFFFGFPADAGDTVAAMSVQKLLVSPDHYSSKVY
jgi:hypothetical protein